MEGLLSLLKLVFLAALYLFVYRVVRTVLVEMRPTPVLPDAGAMAVSPVPVATPNPASTPVLPRGTVGLVILEPSSRAGELVSVTAEVTIGRAPGCGIAIGEDSTMSSLHARVAPMRNGITVEDLGSTNGTFVNGKKVSAPTKAKRGARVQCGNAVFEVVT